MRIRHSGNGPRGVGAGHPQAAAVVGLALDGTPEAIGDGVSGFCARPYDAADIAGRVLEVLSDPDCLRRMGEAGRAFVAPDFLVAVMLERIGTVYLDLLRERQPERVARLERT